jgi:hypothetical protein
MKMGSRNSVVVVAAEREETDDYGSEEFCRQR